VLFALFVILIARGYPAGLDGIFRAAWRRTAMVKSTGRSS
jgi:hypothetical protein